MQKLLASCRECGAPQGVFSNEGELRIKIAQQKKCWQCGVLFGFLPDGRIWNLHWETISTEEALDFWDTIHESIVRVAKNRFESGHYADAVESAFKEINKRVKEIVKSKTGEELDGAGLMFKAFPENNPVIVLDDLSTETGRNIQKGYMHIFAGAMMGIRNPKAHDNIEITKRKSQYILSFWQVFSCIS